MFTAEQQSNGGKAKKGIRKDAISHGLYSMVRSKYGTFEAYFSHLDKTMPGKPADMIAKYIPSEIEQKTQVQHNVLVVNMPEPRQVIDIPCDAGVIEGDLYDVDATGCTLSVGVDGDVVDTEALEGGCDDSDSDIQI